MEGFVDVSLLLRPAVYLLSRQGRVVYVGKSKCPLVRIYTHRSLARQKRLPWIKVRGILFDKVEVLPTLVDDLDKVEQYWIKKLQPVHNIHHNESPEPRTVPLSAILNLPKRQPFERRI